jgi:hypothetical protein
METERDFSNALSAAVKPKRTTFIRTRIDATGYVAQFNKGAFSPGKRDEMWRNG